MTDAVTAYVGLGSNLREPVTQVLHAFGELQEIPHTRVVARSPLYRSAPLGPTDQPDFINAAARLETELAPDALLSHLQAIEKRHGRRRDGVHWGPRTLDLDLLLYGERVLDTPTLTLPHPGIGERGFVLYPLADIDPDLRIPGRGRVRDLLEHCRGSFPERLETESHG